MLLFGESIFARDGFPSEVLSGIVPQFVSSVISEVDRKLQINQVHSTPYHHMSDGLVEGFNVSSVISEVDRKLQINQVHSTPYHHMSDGLVEGFNDTLKKMLTRTCAERHRDWYRYLQHLFFAYRETPQESTKSVPLELSYGRTDRGPIAILK